MSIVNEVWFFYDGSEMWDLANILPRKKKRKLSRYFKAIPASFLSDDQCQAMLRTVELIGK